MSDFIYVGTAFAIGFVVPQLLGINFYGVPGGLVFSVAALFISVSFFNWVRKNHRPKWLEHAIAYKFRELIGRGNNLKRAKVGRARVNYLIDFDEKQNKPGWLTSSVSR